MNVTKRLCVGAAIVLVMSVGAAASNERRSVVEIPIDEVFNYPCIGEEVHVTALIRIDSASFTDSHGGIHGQLIISTDNAMAVGLTSGRSYRYTQRFRDIFYFDSDFAPLQANAASTVVFAALGGGPKLVLHESFKVTIDATGNLAVLFDRVADACTP